jgi:hypothetical protein
MIRRCKRCGVSVTPETGGMLLDLHLLADGRTEECVQFICTSCAQEFVRTGILRAGGECTELLGDLRPMDEATVDAIYAGRSSGKRQYKRRCRHH